MSEEPTSPDASTPLRIDPSTALRVNPSTPAAAGPSPVGRPVEVSDATVHIHELRIERSNIVSYLGKIAPEKQEIALVHALEVGITELIARRERFQR
ncbi:MAG TPA: hypothetical protein VKE96_18035 [Vicinamibacterales bacterium]|nr:hypothetical protein [Vicinamibacterales bacterium]